MHNWDKYSDQPKILNAADKKKLRQGKKNISLKAIWKFIYLFIKFTIIKDNSKQVTDNYFYGLCINLDKGYEQINLIAELGVKSLQIRVFLADIINIDNYVKFTKSFGSDKQILITIIPDRENITNVKLLQKNITIIFNKFNGITTEFMLANAVNRIKWGFININEYLNFCQHIKQIKDKNFSHIKLVGSSIIDFEYFYTTQTLFNNYKIYFDIVASLLYVDRRGSPYNKQYGIFNLENKINFLWTIVKDSNKSSNKIYITETNYPLKNTKPYTPTSDKETINEKLYTKYMLEYFNIAKKTGKINKVFWHQLIAPGYGLVDNRNSKIKKTQAFYTFKSLINNHVK